MARGPVVCVAPRSGVRFAPAALGSCLLLTAVLSAAVSNAPAATQPEWARSSSAFELLATSPAQRHHLGLEVAWRLSQAREALGRSTSSPSRSGLVTPGSGRSISGADFGVSPPSSDDSRWS